MDPAPDLSGPFHSPSCSCGNHRGGLSRRRFLQGAASALLAAKTGPWVVADPSPAPPSAGKEPIIDLHMHCLHRARPDDRIPIHQANNGIRTTILLPAGTTGGLGVGAGGNDHVIAFARRQPERFAYFANENVFRPEARRVIEGYLKTGAIGIGELKDNVACDSAGMEKVAELARDYDVPMLVHFQEGTYNTGYPRFHRMLEKFPTVKFIGHAQTFWAQIGKDYRESQGLMPRGAVIPGGLTDRWLADYPNYYGDLSAGSGNGAMARDTAFTTDFLRRHQDKLLYGSDCPCATGVGPACTTVVKLRFLRQLSPSQEVLDKILFGNVRKLCRFDPAQLA